MTIGVLGEALIDFIRDDHNAYHPHLGGSPFNVAIALSRQGIPVSYLSPLSNDSFGNQLANTLRREGVKVAIDRRSPWPTSMALVTIDEGGAPSYRIYREGVADKDITYGQIRDHLPTGVEIFHTGSLAITPSQLPKIRQLFALMRSSGVLISMDINIRLGASINQQTYLDGVQSLLPMADIVKASDEDLMPLQLASDTAGSAKKALEMIGEGILLVTEGSHGATLMSAGTTIRKPAYSAAPIVDTVGAGDTFHAAFLASLYRHQATKPPARWNDPELLDQSLEMACAASAINVSRAGCCPPNLEEVEAFLRTKKPAKP